MNAPLPWLAIAMAIVTLDVAAQSNKPVEAKLEMGRASRPKPNPQATPIPFDKQDFLRLTAEPPKTTLVLGEPFVVRLRLVNHTRFEVAAVTNFHPRGLLEINLRPYRGKKTRYNGPYQPGQYPTSEFPLFPFEEMPVDVLIWSDPKAANGLAFPAPGRYQVEMRLTNISAKLSNVNGPLTLLDPNDPTLRTTLAPFEVTVVPPPPDLAPLVDELIKLGAFPWLHLKRLTDKDAPPGLPDRLLQLVERYPATLLTPYLDYCIAINAWSEAGANAEDNAKFAVAANYYQRAAAADSAYREAAMLDFVRLLDKRGESRLAREAALRLLGAASPFMATLYGSQTFVKKYLINSAEISPKAYWPLLQ